MRKGYNLGSAGEGGVHDAHVLKVVGGDHLGETLELFAVGNGNAFQVHCVVHGGLELLRLQVKRIHHLLGFPHGQVRCGGLEHVFGIGGGETQHLLPVHHRLAQAVSHLGNAFLGLFIADGIEVHAAGNAGKGGEEEAAVFRSADFLQHDGHLLFRDHVGRGGDIALGGGKIHGGVNALDGLGEEPEFLVLVLHGRNHVGGIYACKRLIVRIFQFGGGTYGKGRTDHPDKGPQCLDEVRGQVGGHKLGEDFRIRDVRIDHILETVFQNETVEVFRSDDQRPGHHYVHVFPLLVEVVLVQDVVQEGQAAGFSAQGPLAETGEPDGVVVGVGIEARHHAQALPHAVVVDERNGHGAELGRGGQPAALDGVSFLEDTAGQ